MPLSDSHIRVTTTLSQRVVYFANETKDCDPPPDRKQMFLRTYGSSKCYFRYRVFTTKEVHRLEVNSQGDTPHHCL